MGRTMRRSEILTHRSGLTWLLPLIVGFTYLSNGVAAIAQRSDDPPPTPPVMTDHSYYKGQYNAPGRDMFHGAGFVNTAVVGKACGAGLDQHSKCGPCHYVNGRGASKGTICGHVCVKLPDDKTMSDFHSEVWAAVREGDRPKRCGPTDSFGACDVQYSRSERFEWYEQTHMACGRYKNWNSDEGRCSIYIYGSRRNPSMGTTSTRNLI